MLIKCVVTTGRFFKCFVCMLSFVSVIISVHQLMVVVIIAANVLDNASICDDTLASQILQNRQPRYKHRHSHTLIQLDIAIVWRRKIL